MSPETFLGLRATHNPHRWLLPVEPRLCVREGFLFGGVGLASGVAALEATTGRPLVWATAQYLSYARPPAIMDLDVVVPVTGKHTTQGRAIGQVGDSEIFTVNAALGRRPLSVEHQWAQMPAAPPPEDCEEAPPWPGREHTINASVDLRVVRGRYGQDRDGTPSPDGHSILWARIPDMDMSAPALAVIADWMPSGVGNALGLWAMCNSLDNTIRIVRLVDTEWVLADIRVQAVHAGFGHGFMQLWSRDGQLMAVGSQSLIIRLQAGESVSR